MKFKVEFEIEETDEDITEEDMMKFLEFEFGTSSSMKITNLLEYAQLMSCAKNVKITKIK